MPKKRIIKSDDDTVLWQRVITEVTPLKSTIELAEFAAIFARSDHVLPSVAKPSGRPQKPPLSTRHARNRAAGHVALAWCIELHRVCLVTKKKTRFFSFGIRK